MKKASSTTTIKRMFLRRAPFYTKIIISCFVLMTCFSLLNNQVRYITFDEASNAVNHRMERIWEAQIQADLQRIQPGLGDLGRAVNLTGESGEQAEKDIATMSMNEELSRHLSYNRTPPDPRHKQCKTFSYGTDLPTASVVIVFFNEPYSVILRTVHSVLNTVETERILQEVILVDDGSSLHELKQKLDYYVSTRLPKMVKLLRLPERSGLIRARLAGARLAKSEVLVYLDAHCECAPFWLEPLLERIQQNPKAVVTPIIDSIDYKTFKYSASSKRFAVGGFTWDGHFDWHNVPKREKQRQKKECPDRVPEVCPTYSPTMAGGLFAMRRDYFWELGSYDEQMDGWGGENLEMSFRIWQCGGTLETIPCSRIGHIFRDFHPYSFPNDRDTHGINTVRMALVWMDEYIEFFFMNRPDLREHPEVGDVTHRRLLREKLKCKSFDWYMNNIYPEKYVPTKNALQYGRVTSNSGEICLDDLSQNADDPFNLGIYNCYHPEITNSQFFSLSKNGVFRNERNCATVPDFDSPGTTRKLIQMVPCNFDDEVDDRFEWTAQKQLRHTESGLCVDHSASRAQDFVTMTDCDDKSPTQKWDFEHNN